MKRRWWQESGAGVQALLKDPRNRRQAIAQGWKPPAPMPDLDPTERLLAQGVPKVVAISPAQLEAGAADARRRKADRVLQQFGIKAKPWV